MNKKTIVLSALAIASLGVNAQSILFPLDGDTKEVTTQTSCTMNGVQALPYAQGVKGECARFDGYSNYISGTPSYSNVTPEQITFSLWLAPETYPMMNSEQAEVTPTYTMVAGNYDESAKTGIGLYLSSQGDYQARIGVGTRTIVYQVKDDRIELGKWNNISITVNTDEKKLFIYRNGIKQAQNLDNQPYTLSMGTSSFLIGKDRSELKAGQFHINTFNGLIDEVRIDNGAKTADAIKSEYESTQVPTIDAIPVTSLLSDSKYGFMRPQFHGMPAKNWTNESHGMVYYNGKYHVFFQKNGNGPYMSRLHWGHITSTDLVNWSEEPIAIAPGASANNLEANDGKGCWSGCVFTDPDINGGKPTILYTGVSNAKAFIWQAAPKDDNLIEWEKQGILISSNGNPCNPDASDDFRDPYFFTANGQKYIIIGTSNKSKIGTCLLYKYTGSTWAYQGLFFSGTSQISSGRFWEMPNVTPLGDGKYLFTCTPLDITSIGVRTLYWVGTIGADGKFTPDSATPKTMELSGMAKDGYCMLSPTIYQKDGKTLALGIVPDKIATGSNAELGYAHCYSLPREWNIDEKGNLQQKPAAEVLVLQDKNTLRETKESIAELKGRQIEVKATFQVADNIGIELLKKGDKSAKITYNHSTKNLTIDFSGLKDCYATGSINKYSSTLPENLANDASITIDAWLDGSILDVFINDKWATSVRVFCKDADANGVGIIGTPTEVKAWELKAGTTAIEEIPTAGIASQTRNSDSARFVVEDGWVRLYNGKKRVF